MRISHWPVPRPSREAAATISDTLSSPGGDIPTASSNLTEILDRLAGIVEENRPELTRLARRWMRRVRVDEIRLAPDGAVDEAWATFQERLEAGSIGSPLGPGEFLQRFRRLVIEAVVDEGRRQGAAKRGRWRTVPLSVLARDGFELIDRRALRPEDEVGGAEQARYLVGLLARQGDGLERIAVLKEEGHTNDEIGRRLDRSVATVERGLKRMRALLAPHV